MVLVVRWVWVCLLEMGLRVCHQGQGHAVRLACMLVTHLARMFGDTQGPGACMAGDTRFGRTRVCSAKPCSLATHCVLHPKPKNKLC